MDKNSVQTFRQNEEQVDSGVFAERPLLTKHQTDSEGIPDLATRFKTGLLNGFRTSFLLLKVVLPLYVGISLVKGTAVFNAIGHQFQPMMSLFDLPGEAVFAFIAAFFINIYAAMAILVPLDLTPWQITQCGVMMGIAHELILEGGVLLTAGMRGATLTLIRLVAMVACGFLITTLTPYWIN